MIVPLFVMVKLEDVSLIDSCDLSTVVPSIVTISSMITVALSISGL